MYLPYHVKTEFGEELDIDFTLHDQTGDPVQVEQILSALLATLDREVKVLGGPANGDVLQACAMALAIRAGIVPVPMDVTRELIGELLGNALAAVGQSKRNFPVLGNA